MFDGGDYIGRRIFLLFLHRIVPCLYHHRGCIVYSIFLFSHSIRRLYYPTSPYCHIHFDVWLCFQQSIRCLCQSNYRFCHMFDCTDFIQHLWIPLPFIYIRMMDRQSWQLGFLLCSLNVSQRVHQAVGLHEDRHVSKLFERVDLNR